MDRYSYSLPEELCAKTPAEPRDSARLFVYNTQTDEIVFDTFRNLSKHLPDQSVMVLNNTKVMPARLRMKKETGGKIEVFVLVNEMKEDAETVIAIVDRKIELGQKLYFEDGAFLEVISQDEQRFFLKPSFAISELSSYLDKYGETPIPKYIQGGILDEVALRKRYQTIFAEKGGSVAAPTASLHFTDAVFKSLEEKSIEILRTTLHVGMGTFAPIHERNFKEKRLHKEWCEVSDGVAEKLSQCKQEGRAVVAVGTTATRTLETASLQGHITPYVGTTDIFIFPPFDFKTVDCLITNFHLPNTSLMYLVDAFLQQKGAKKNIIDLYTIAIQEKFRFYSFGDSMLIV